MKRAVLMGLAAIALVLTIGFGWISVKHTRDLERRLEDSKREAEELGQRVEDYGRDRDRAMEIAAAARGSAESSEQEAMEAAAGRVSAENATLAAEAAKKRAEAEAQESRQELTSLKERREKELNRMHEALARIASTRRTGSGMIIELTNDSFHFDFAKATLRPANREILSRIAGVLLASNGYRLYVHGHTDDLGSGEYNRLLSEQRAGSVASYLISAGIDPEVMETRGFGKTSPRAKGKTPEARQENRRVEIVLVDSVIHYQGEVSRKGAG